MAVERLLPTDEGVELVALVREVAQAELAPRAAAEEAAGRYPRDVFAALGGLGLLGMPYPEEVGGLGQPYEVYLQALEEVAAAWMSVAVGVSVHVMSCHPLATWGTPAQQQAHLPDLLGGGLLGGYALSEPQAGSDIAGMTSRAKRTDEGYELHGAKAWVTHGSRADAYTVFARVGDTPPGGITCFLVPGDAAGLGFGAPERKMGLTASVTAGLHLDGVAVADDRRIGDEGQGMRIALSALDSGRLGIAACATGLAQAALDLAVGYAQERQQFGRAVAEFQGMQFLLADMAAAVDSARATYLLAARKRDAGMAFTRDAAVAKLVATDAAMRVTTDAVQVLGGYGYTADFPAERYMREAKVTQIFEGTNQIQRLVIGRQLLGSLSGSSRAPR
ncbi:acyl-CoA dehydrogenase family protein [Microlunatus capsulatus]|uniref:Alkylation response protein AidB-like acyl-CoA dehydrogenase n=1 Tax=Microlunatus capsulatus TaxID=99117 RepID=A0ABS4ZA10_9ACTN|nr:acyl-CoA dehydrogenase family protein [Microlunatus capsulatus]MBP2417887.1 alkylation response protein AidB-like acyl-CoA dehydrogenase [Microlunatus capsulatus]